MLTEEIDKILSEDLSSPLLSGGDITQLCEALSILHACGQTSHMGTTLSSIASTLCSLLGIVNRDLSGFALGQIPVAHHSLFNRLSTILTPLQELIQVIENFQSQQVPTLVQLSVRAVRFALAGPIQQNLENLLAKQAPQWQHLLHNQIHLEETMGSNSLDGLEDALSSVATLDVHLSRECTSPTDDYDDDGWNDVGEYEGYGSDQS